MLFFCYRSDSAIVIRQDMTESRLDGKRTNHTVKCNDIAGSFGIPSTPPFVKNKRDEWRISFHRTMSLPTVSHMLFKYDSLCHLTFVRLQEPSFDIGVFTALYESRLSTRACSNFSGFISHMKPFPPWPGFVCYCLPYRKPSLSFGSLPITSGPV